MTVSNATPLIYLSRISKLQLLKEIFIQVQIPPEVKVETIDRGKEKGYSDAYAIEQAMNEEWLTQESLAQKNREKSEALARMMGIDVGEAQAIILAKQKNEKDILIDQSNARAVARNLGLNPRGTIFVLLTALKRKLITKDTAKQMLHKLIETNFYISVNIYR
ncbi:MAG: DUF3368 domain-containing protein, partial [Thermoproteota archaeon]|nr:DUF3368 domain-containing protein [Thermoproteota archaeon]